MKNFLTLGLAGCLALATACTTTDDELLTRTRPTVDSPRMADDIHTPWDERASLDDSNDVRGDRSSITTIATPGYTTAGTGGATLTLGTATVGRQFYTDRARPLGVVNSDDLALTAAQEVAVSGGAVIAAPGTNVAVAPTILASDNQVSSTVNANAVPALGQRSVSLTPPQRTTTGTTNAVVTDVPVTGTIAAGASPVTSTVNANVPTAAVDVTTSAALRGNTIPNATTASAATQVAPADRSMNATALGGSTLATSATTAPGRTVTGTVTRAGATAPATRRTSRVRIDNLNGQTQIINVDR
jgi:hypothetical protein